jgi:hypothetical protein
MAVVEAWAEPASFIALDKHIDVANVIRLENDSHCRRMRVESLPHFSRGGRRSQRIQDQPLAPGFDKRRRDDRLPALARPPARVFDPPYPEAWRYIVDLGVRLRGWFHRALPPS